MLPPPLVCCETRPGWKHFAWPVNQVQTVRNNGWSYAGLTPLPASDDVLSLSKVGQTTPHYWERGPGYLTPEATVTEATPRWFQILIRVIVQSRVLSAPAVANLILFLL